ncbi:MAG: RNA-binding protein [Clostridia bacterium]|nr:RNA-binding protein [Clostridia bacterium]
MTHYMKLQPSPFETMKIGMKDIEMRLNDDKRQAIKIGDIIEFTNTESGEILKVKVINKHHFNSFDDLYKTFDKSRLGYRENEVAHPNDMTKYYPKEEIAQNGVVGVEIQLI